MFLFQANILILRYPNLEVCSHGGFFFGSSLAVVFRPKNHKFPKDLGLPRGSWVPGCPRWAIFTTWNRQKRSRFWTQVMASIIMALSLADRALAESEGAESDEAWLEGGNLGRPEDRTVADVFTCWGWMVGDLFGVGIQQKMVKFQCALEFQLLQNGWVVVGVFVFRPQEGFTKPFDQHFSNGCKPPPNYQFKMNLSQM